MRRLPLAIAAASALAAAALPATAAATEVQLGQTSTAVVAPTCPAGTSAVNCKILLTQMTGLPTLSDGIRYPTRVKQDGIVTAMTIGISSAAKSFVAGLNTSYGGQPEAELTVLRPVGGAGRYRWQVVAESAPQPLAAYQGAVVEFPLSDALPVVPGEVVALTTPTWAPVLSIQLATGSFAYRQPVVPTPETPGAAPTCWQYKLSINGLSAPLTIGAQSTYGCSYPGTGAGANAGTRIQFTATEVTTPSPTASIRLARRIDRQVRRPRIIRRPSA